MWTLNLIHLKLFSVCQCAREHAHGLSHVVCLCEQKPNTAVEYVAAHLSKIHGLDWHPDNEFILATSSQDNSVRVRTHLPSTCRPHAIHTPSTHVHTPSTPTQTEVLTTSHQLIPADQLLQNKLEASDVSVLSSFAAKRL